MHIHNGQGNNWHSSFCLVKWTRISSVVAILGLREEEGISSHFCYYWNDRNCPGVTHFSFVLIEFVLWQLHTCVYNVFWLLSSPLSFSHPCMFSVPLLYVSSSHLVLFVCFVNHWFTQGHLHGYRFGAVHRSLVGSPLCIQLKTITLPSPESIYSQ